MTLTRPARVVSFALLSALIAVSPSAAAAQQRSFESTIGDLKSPDPKTRLAAVRMLHESGYPEAIAPIAPLLEDRDERVAKEAMYAELGLLLGTSIGTERRVALVVQKTRSPNAALRAFDAGWGMLPVEHVPPEVVRGVARLLSRSERALKIEATYALAALAQIDGPPGPEHPSVSAALAARLGDPEPAVRVAAARAAGRVFRRCTVPCAGADIERVGDALVHSLNDPDTGVVMAVLEGLGEMRYERALKPLTDFHAFYKQGPLALASLDAIGRIGHASSIPLFKASLLRREPAALRAAVEGLARAGDKDAVASAAASLARQRRPEVTLGVAFARVKTGESAALDTLIQAAGGRDTSLQVQDYLVELGPAVSKPVAAVLPAASSVARQRLIEVLGVIGEDDQLPALQAAEKDESAAVAAAAGRAARRLKAR